MPLCNPSIARTQRLMSASLIHFVGKQSLGHLWRSRQSSRVFSEIRGMTTADNAVVIQVTVPDKKVATTVASKLVEEKLAACVQTIPGILSTYWWEGKVETSEELLLLIKTRQALTDKVVDQVNALHPYDVAEIIATPIEGGSSAYLKWVTESTT